MAEGVRFELTEACTSPVFKTGALNHSATPPLERNSCIAQLYEKPKTLLWGDSFYSTHVWPQYLWNGDTAVCLLVVLQDGDDGTSNS